MKLIGQPVPKIVSFKIIMREDFMASLLPFLCLPTSLLFTPSLSFHYSPYAAKRLPWNQPWKCSKSKLPSDVRGGAFWNAFGASSVSKMRDNRVGLVRKWQNWQIWQDFVAETSKEHCSTKTRRLMFHYNSSKWWSIIKTFQTNVHC